MNKLILGTFFSISLMTLGGSVMAAPPDDKGDGTGWCDGLDPSSGLYSTCIQAHSAANRVEHLQSKNASANAVSKAQAAVDESIAQYAELGGGTVPGFESPLTCPCYDEAGTAYLATGANARCIEATLSDRYILQSSIGFVWSGRTDAGNIGVPASPAVCSAGPGQLQYDISSQEMSDCKALIVNTCDTNSIPIEALSVN